MAETTQPAGALPPASLITSLDIGHRAYTEGDMRTLMAERDAAREERDTLQRAVDNWLEELPKAQAEAAALRRELEELRAQEPVAWTARGRDGMPKFGRGWFFGKVQNDVGNMPLYARPIPPDAREGREPLTGAQIIEAHNSCEGGRPGDPYAFARAIERAHGIGPVGTSAEGEN